MGVRSGATSLLVNQGLRFVFGLVAMGAAASALGFPLLTLAFGGYSNFTILMTTLGFAGIYGKTLSMASSAGSFLMMRWLRDAYDTSKNGQGAAFLGRKLLRSAFGIAVGGIGGFMAGNYYGAKLSGSVAHNPELISRVSGWNAPGGMDSEGLLYASSEILNQTQTIVATGLGKAGQIWDKAGGLGEMFNNMAAAPEIQALGITVGAAIGLALAGRYAVVKIYDAVFGSDKYHLQKAQKASASAPAAAVS